MPRLKIPFRSSLHGLAAQTRAVRGISSSISQVSATDPEFKPFNAIPGPKGIYLWPIIGPIMSFKPFTKFTPETTHEYFNHLYDKYGPVVRLRLGSHVVVVSDPKDFETVFRNEGKYPIRGDWSLAEAYTKRQNVQPSITQLKGAEWHSMRAPVNKVLMKTDSALHYLEQQNEVADDFVKILETQKISPEALQDLFFRYASESIGVVAFNKRLGLFEENPDKGSVDFLRAAETSLNMIMRAVMGKSIAHRWFRNSTYQKFESAMNLARRVAIGHITQARQLLENEMKTGNLTKMSLTYFFPYFRKRD